MKRKFLFIAIALVVAMGGLGIGYAAWTDEVTITGTVSTAEVCMTIDCPFILLPGEDVPAPPYYPVTSGMDYNGTQPPGINFWRDPRLTEKNVGWVTTNCDQTPSPRDTVTITFHNMYPSYLSHPGFTVTNCGTLPLKIDHVVVTAQGYDPVTIYNNTYFQWDLNGNGYADFEMWWGDNFGVQVEPGGGWSFDFYTHFLQDEEMDFTVEHTYTFTIQIVAVQWNEYPLPVLPP